MKQLIVNPIARMGVRRIFSRILGKTIDYLPSPSNLMKPRSMRGTEMDNDDEHSL